MNVMDVIRAKAKTLIATGDTHLIAKTIAKKFTKMSADNAEKLAFNLMASAALLNNSVSYIERYVADGIAVMDGIEMEHDA